MRKSTLWAQPWAMPLATIMLMAATVVSRLPFVSKMLYAWDSANFALALNYYNVAFHQPHPPGYPLYVGIAKLIDIWVQDPNASYVYISIAASAGAVGALFLLASRMYDPWAGLASAAVLAASVGFWGYGEVAYPYTSLAFFGTLVAWLCYLMWQDHRSVAILSGLVLGIAGGVREDTLLFLGPLWLISVWRTGILRLILSGLVMLMVVAAWFIPTVQLSGGWAVYQRASDAQGSYVLSTYSALFGGLTDLRRNTETLILFLKQMFGLSLALTLYFIGRFLTLKALVADRRVAFLLLWFVPPAVVYTVIHIGDPGYLLSLLPPLCLVTGVGIRDIVYDAQSAMLHLSGRYRRISWLSALARDGSAALGLLLVVGLVAWNVDAFTSTPGPVRLVEIRTIDNILSRQVAYARSFKPGSVVILANERLRQFQYYLPQYNVRLLFNEYQLGYREARYSYQIPNGVNRVLIMDFGKPPARFPNAAGGKRVLSDDANGRVTLWQFDVKPGDTIMYGYDYFAVNGRN